MNNTYCRQPSLPNICDYEIPGVNSRYNNLEQIVSFPTRKDDVLYLFMTNRPSLVNRCEPLPRMSNHDNVYIDNDITSQQRSTSQHISKYSCEKNADKSKLEEMTRSMNTGFQSKLHSQSPIKAMWDFIKKNLPKIIEDTCSVPSKLSSTRFHQTWMIKDYQDDKRSLIKARNTKNKADNKRYQRFKN